MKVFVIFLLISIGIIVVLPAYAQCIYDPTNPHEPCDDTQLLIEKYAQVEILPDEDIYYGEKFTIHVWLSDYENKPNDSGYFVDILDQQNNQIDSTLWFAKSDFLYLFDTIHPVYDITSDKTYKIRIEKADSMQRTGIFSDMMEFEIKKRFDVLPPLKQFHIGVLPQKIICKENLVLVQKHNNLPACVTESTKQKLMERGWTKSVHTSELTHTCKGDGLCLTEKVTRIIDGDTLYLGDYKIRLSLTNTPERHEIGFYDASKFTAEMCPVGSVVLVDQDDLQPYDVYDRLLGKVICANKVLNSELLYAGHANILTQYCTESEFSNEPWAQEFGC